MRLLNPEDQLQDFDILFSHIKDCLVYRILESYGYETCFICDGIGYYSLPSKGQFIPELKVDPCSACEGSCKIFVAYFRIELPPKPKYLTLRQRRSRINKYLKELAIADYGAIPLGYDYVHKRRRYKFKKRGVIKIILEGDFLTLTRGIFKIEEKEVEEKLHDKIVIRPKFELNLTETEIMDVSHLSIGTIIDQIEEWGKEFRDLRDEAYKLEDELEPRVKEEEFRDLTDDEEKDLTY